MQDKNCGDAGYRTRAKAGKVTDMPEKPMLAVVSLAGYQNGLTFNAEGSAYLAKMDDADKFIAQNGRLYSSETHAAVLDDELDDLLTGKGIEKIDLPFLIAIYTLVLRAYERNGYHERNEAAIMVYVPDLVRYIGGAYKQNARSLETIASRIQSFGDVVGIIADESHDAGRRLIYKALVYKSKNPDANTVTFTCPYLDCLVNTIMSRTCRVACRGLGTTGREHTHYYPSHTFLIKSEIVLEKNKAAVLNVVILTVLIEQAGNGKPHLRVETLIRRNRQLHLRLGGIRNASDQNIVLKRVFSKTWDLLRKMTTLYETYMDFKAPDVIPTMATLDAVLMFSHGGKTKGG